MLSCQTRSPLHAQMLWFGRQICGSLGGQWQSSWQMLWLCPKFLAHHLLPMRNSQGGGIYPCCLCLRRLMLCWKRRGRMLLAPTCFSWWSFRPKDLWKLLRKMWRLPFQRPQNIGGVWCHSRCGFCCWRGRWIFHPAFPTCLAKSQKHFQSSILLRGEGPWSCLFWQTQYPFSSRTCSAEWCWLPPWPRLTCWLHSLVG